MKNAVYLKVNRNEEFALRNLSRWIDVSILLNADCYILCDNPELNKIIKTDCMFSYKCNFIESNKGEEAKEIVCNIANKNWADAAYAHLTTFIHAAELGYDYFWNIDADDTMICLSTDRILEMLRKVEGYVIENNTDIISLDMWRTKWQGLHWSFGITFTKGRKEWLSDMKKHCMDEAYKNQINGMNYNIDCYFTYLKEVENISIQTFYFENLKFIHYSNDFFKGLISSAFYHWKNGILEYPIMKWCVGVNELSEFKICDDIIRFDIGIDDKEAAEVLTYYSRDGHEFRGFVDWENVINKKLFSEKRKLYLDQLDEDCEIICFGVGNCLDNNIDKIKNVFDVKYVCDNDSHKWGKEYYDGILCISTEELKNKKAMIVISVYSKRVSLEIAEQLKEMNISNFDFIDNILKCVE